MKHLRNKMAVGATLVSLGGLTAVAMSQGTAKRRASTAAPAADVRTVTVEQTVHRYRHVGLGDGAHGSATQTAAVHVGWAKAAAVATRASGSHAASRSGGGGTVSGSHVKSYASGAKGGEHRSTGSSGHSNGAPTTKSSGSKAEHKPAGSGSSSEGPTTKPSGAGASEGSGGSTPTSPPTTKPSGASGSGGTGTETTPTPPPTTKPSGSTGGGTEESGKTEGHEGREHEHDD